MNPAAWTFGMSDMAKKYPTAAMTIAVSNLTLTVDTSGSSSANGQPLMLYALTWGDGTQTVQYTPIIASHTYAASGRIRLQLTVTDSAGLTRTHTQSATVSAVIPPPPPPQTPPAGSPTLLGLAITGPTQATTGQSLTYFCTGTFSDGSQQDFTPTATWVSSNTGTALVSAPGLITTVAAGSTGLTATASGYTAPSFTLTVSAPPVAPPTLPGAPHPNDASVGITTTPTLTWSSTGATGYTVRFSSSTPPAPVFSGLSAASFTPSPLQNSITYYWQVTATNSSGSTAGPIWSFTTQAAPPPPPSGSPTTDPLIQPSNLTLVGSFRVPQATTGDRLNGFSYGGGPIAFNAAGSSLFMAGLSQYVAEISIPTPLIASTVAGLNTAMFVQTFADPTEGHYGQSTIPNTLGGMLVNGSDLYGAGYIYYDGSGTASVSQFKRSTTLSSSSFSGWQALWQADKQGFVGGAFTPVPSAWQTLLGGDTLVSCWGLPIIERTSFGPDAFSFSLSEITGGSLAAATPLLYYPQAHPTLGLWENTSAANPAFNMATNGNGIVLMPKWRTALIFGRTGTGVPGYGEGTANPALVGTPPPDDPTGTYIYDPTNSSKGTHAYPYTYYVWAYDLNDFVSVKAGTKNPWDIAPYATWSLPLPFQIPACPALYASVDALRGEIYLSQLWADPGGGYFAGPIVHVFSVS